MKSYSVEDGLLSSTVYGIYQDKEGFMWFATESGVNRYDGASFEAFTVADGLPSNTAFAFAEDNTGRLWVSCNNSKPAFFNGKSWTANHTLVNPVAESGTYRNLSFQKHQDDLYFNFGYQLFRLNENEVNEVIVQLDSILNKKFEVVLNNKREDSFREIQLLNDGSLYLHSTTATYYVKNNFGSLIDYRKNYSTLIRFLGDMCFRASGKTVEYSKLSGSKSSLVGTCHVNSHIQNIQVTANHEIWIDEKDFGLRCFAFDSLGNFNLKYQLKGVSGMSAIYVDKEQSTWLATLSSGVIRIDQNPSIVYQNEGLFGTNAYYAIEKGPSGTMLAGNSKGQVIQFNGLFPIRITSLPMEQEGRVLKLLMESNKIWAATDKGLFVLNTKLQSQLISSFPVKTMLLGLKHNYVAYFLAPERFDKLKSPKAAPLFKKIIKIYSLLETQQSQLIVGGQNGLEIWSTTDTINLAKKYPNLLDCRITGLLYDGLGKLWVATHANGLAIMQNDTIFYKCLDQRVGLPSNQIQNLRYDARGFIWASTNKGLVRIDEKTHNFQFFNTGNILPHNDVNDCIVVNDSVWVATANGIAIFRDSTRTDSYQFETKFRHLKCNGNVISDTNQVIFLQPDQNNIELSFSALTFKGNSGMSFEFIVERQVSRLENWILDDIQVLLRRIMGQNTLFTKHIKETGRLDLYSLIPGRYKVQAIGRRQDGFASLAPATVVFEIEPRLIQSFWTQLTLLVLFCTLVFRFFWWRNQVAKNELALKQQLGQLQFEAFKTRINPHFIFNSINGIQQFFFRPDPYRANKYVTLLAHLLRKTMEMSDVNFVSLKEEVQYLNEYLELAKLRLGEQLQFKINESASIPAHFQIPSMVLQPLIENAIIHGGINGNVRLTVAIEFESDGVVICKVEDEGNGINAVSARKQHSMGDEKSRSRGLSLIRSRIETLNTVFKSQISLEVLDRSTISPRANGTVALLKMKNLYERLPD